MPTKRIETLAGECWSFSFLPSSLLAPHLQSGADTLMASARISLVVHPNRAKKELDKVTGPNLH